MEYDISETKCTGWYQCIYVLPKMVSQYSKLNTSALMRLKINEQDNGMTLTVWTA